MGYKIRSDKEWMSIIQACKSSGYSDIEWCRQNNIAVSTFYRRLNALREKACVDEISKPVIRDEQQVVPVNLREELPKPSQDINDEVALRLNINGVAIDIFNSATQTTIENTLQSLRSLC